MHRPGLDTRSSRPPLSPRAPRYAWALAGLGLCGLSLLFPACDKDTSDAEEVDKSSKEDKDETEDQDDKKSKGKKKKKKESSEKEDSKKKDKESDEEKSPDKEEPEEESSSSEGEGDSNETGTSEGENSSDKKDKTDSSDTGSTEGDKESGPIPCKGDTPKVVLETNHGKIVLVLDGTRAPITVANFIQYVNDKHYDNTIFHRIISGFMIQGGGYDTNNKLKKTRPPIKLEIHPELKHKAGTLAMARTNVKDSATDQFYICVNDTGCKGLDGDYAAFGQTVEGLKVVQEISKVSTNSADKPHKDVILNSAYCIES